MNLTFKPNKNIMSIDDAINSASKSVYEVKIGLELLEDEKPSQRIVRIYKPDEVNVVYIMITNNVPELPTNIQSYEDMSSYIRSSRESPPLCKNPDVMDYFFSMYLEGLHSFEKRLKITKACAVNYEKAWNLFNNLKIPYENTSIIQTGNIQRTYIKTGTIETFLHDISLKDVRMLEYICFNNIKITYSSVIKSGSAFEPNKEYSRHFLYKIANSALDHLDSAIEIPSKERNETKFSVIGYFINAFKKH